MKETQETGPEIPPGKLIFPSLCGGLFERQRPATRLQSARGGGGGQKAKEPTHH
jgi:hypothetical protein